MARSYYLAVDLGATSGRTVLAAFDGQKVELRELTRFNNPIVPLCGHLFWNLPALYYEVLSALRKVAGERIRLTSVGIDAWGCDVACFAADGTLVGLPYCYRDAHTEHAMERFFERMAAERVYGLTGIQFMPFNTLFQLDSLRSEGCAALAADKILFMPDALSYMLTGEAVMEYTVASTSQMLNPRTGDLDQELLATLGLPRDKFARMVWPGTAVGRLTPQVRQFTGCGDIPVVAVAGHDTASAVAAVPVVEDGFAYLSCGTWSLLGIESPKPIITADSFRHNFTNEGGLDGTTRFLKNICGLWLFERCREEFEGAPQDVVALSALCEQSVYDGLIDPDWEGFARPSSMVQAIREYCNRSQQAAPETPADFCRCIYRSLALRYRQVIELLQTMAPFTIRRLHVIGGGSKNRFLMQYAADATGLPVVAGPTEGTALGNVLVQIRAANGGGSLADMRRLSAASVDTVVYEPGRRGTWDDAYARFREVQEKAGAYN